MFGFYIIFCSPIDNQEIYTQQSIENQLSLEILSELIVIDMRIIINF